jgi:hypothetical protein
MVTGVQWRLAHDSHLQAQRRKQKSLLDLINDGLSLMGVEIHAL